MLYAYPMDRFGCGHYRVVYPLNAVGDTVPHKLVYPGDDHGLAAKTRGGRVVGVELPSDCTGVYMQRPTQENLVDALEHVHHQGVPVYIDVDDNLNALSARHPAFYHLHPHSPRRLAGHSTAAIVRACKFADKVFCSTPELLSVYAKHGRGVLLRNRLPEWALGIERPGHHTTDVSVGWPGAVDTHPDDLSVLNPALRRAGVAQFKVIGPLPNLDLYHQESTTSVGQRMFGVPTTFTGAVNFDHWLAQVAKLDLGVAPLSDSRFNHSKSALKLLELAAAGVPHVRSQTPEYEHLGVGIGATTTKQWMRHLRALYESDTLRSEERERNTALVQTQTYEHHRQEWIDAFQH